MTYPGSDSSLPSLILYCHTDVVPTFLEHWIYPPYSAHKDEKGDIYARGAQVCTISIDNPKISGLREMEMII
jgi:acetylornithine deacetylase/succinyl-diaminopimelate desuccinylase-like protein